MRGPISGDVLAVEHRAGYKPAPTNKSTNRLIVPTGAEHTARRSTLDTPLPRCQTSPGWPVAGRLSRPYPGRAEMRRRLGRQPINIYNIYRGG